MTDGPSPLSCGLRPQDGELVSPLWTTRFWLTQAPFIAPHEPQRRSQWPTRVRIERGEAEWTVYFECDSPPCTELPREPLRAVGDPDLWQAEYVQIQMPVGEEGGCLHLSVSRSGQMLSEHFDKRRDPIAGWRATTEETPSGWRARISLPRAAVPQPWKLRLARWTSGEGLTRWPTPFGSWWHVQAHDFLEVDCENVCPNEQLDGTVELWMTQREASLFAAAGTPDPRLTAPCDWHQAASGFLKTPPESGALLRHLQRRLEEQPWLAFGVLPLPDMALCRGLLENRVYFRDAVLDLGAEPGWDDDHGNPFVMAHVTRFDFLADLLAAFRHSGDEAYARCAVDLIASWLAGNDMRQSLTPNRYPMRWAPRIIVSHRLVCMVRALFSLLATGLVSEALLLRLFAAVRETALVLSPDLARKYPKNHSIIIGDHFVQLSVLCSELTAAETIRAEYFAHLGRALETQFLPDGVQNELSTSYHIVCYTRLTEATSLCEQAGVPIPQEITAWRRRILTVAAYYLLPNGQIAAFNDGHMGATTDAIGEDDKDLRALILRDAPALDAQEALVIARGGDQAGTPLCHALPYAGHFILRDGLSPGSMALAFDAGPLGLAHAHEDALSLMLVRYGKPLLIDIGSGAYDADLPMRGYSVSTHAHSTICVDGEDQAARYFPQFWKRDTPLESRHFFGRAVHFVEGEYSLGYGPDGAIAVRHRRMILFVCGAYVLVADYLSGAGAHRIESHFALAPLPHRPTPQGLITTSSDGDLEVRALYPSTITTAVAFGQHEPFAGWMPDGLYGQQPCPHLTLQLDAELPCCLLTLLAPFRTAEEIPRTRVHETPEHLRVEIAHGEQTATFQCSRTPRELSYATTSVQFGATSAAEGKWAFTEDVDHSQ
jgi:hypothetical protein